MSRNPFINHYVSMRDNPPDHSYSPVYARHTPLHYPSTTTIPYQWPPPPDPTIEPPGPESVENRHHTPASRRESEEPAKKKRHYLDSGVTADGKRITVVSGRGFQQPNDIAQAPRSTTRQAPAVYTAPYPHQSASTVPSLPGAERYKQRNRLVSTPPPKFIKQSRRAARSAVPTAEEPSREHSLDTPDTYKRRRKDASGDQVLYPALPQPAEMPAPSMGTQHNPLEIDSSPERAPSKKPIKAKKKKFYAVAIGEDPGIYETWADVERRVKGWSGAKHKSFDTYEDALAWYNRQSDGRYGILPNGELKAGTRMAHQAVVSLETGPTGQPSTNMYLNNAFLDAVNPYTVPLPTLRQPEPETTATEPAADPEPVLTSEQQKVVDLILKGNNVFYTGSAGCGKSTILQAVVKRLHAQGKRVKIVAPTNLAALNVGGITTWAFAGWTPDSMKKSLDKLMQAALGKEVYERLNSVDVLVIDEISMVENLMFERLNEVMKASIGEARGGGPFGGVQIVVTGDFCQLSPVRPFQHCIGCGWKLERDNKWRPTEYRCENRFCREDVFYDIDKWAFRSKAWEACQFVHANLTEIHRQSDKKFIAILQHIRMNGVILKPHANILLNHTSETENAILLFARRDDVDRVNNENIAKLPSEAITYNCVDHFDWKDQHREDTSLEKNARLADDGTLTALKEHRYEVFVNLKEGMRVVLQANLDPNGGLVNGSQGVITGFEPFDDKRLPRKVEMSRNDFAMGMSTGQSTRGAYAKYFEEQIKIYSRQNNRKPWPIVKFDNGVTKTIFADCTANELGNEAPYSLLSRTQIPLMAGYAITVHKSQGMTLDRVIVDLSRAFEPSQIYVALSRARSLKGLKVVGLPQTSLGGANPQVKEFYETYLKNKPVE